MRIAVTGASGLLGQDIVDCFAIKHEVFPLRGRKTLDVSDISSVINYFRGKGFDLTIHTAGWRDLDDCEANIEKTLMINCLGTRNVVYAARMLDCPLVFISSDAVYDGEKKEPYTEFDETKPLNAYGYSKVQAEKIIKELYDRYFIIRAPILFGSKGSRERNLIYNIWDKIKQGEDVPATIDQYCSPTYTVDMAEALLRIVETDYYGTYLLSNEGMASRYELFRKIAELKGLDTNHIIPISSKGKTAKRARNTVFNCTILKRTFGMEFDHWEHALERCISNMH